MYELGSTVSSDVSLQIEQPESPTRKYQTIGRTHDINKVHGNFNNINNNKFYSNFNGANNANKASGNTNRFNNRILSGNNTNTNSSSNNNKNNHISVHGDFTVGTEFDINEETCKKLKAYQDRWQYRVGGWFPPGSKDNSGDKQYLWELRRMVMKQ